MEAALASTGVALFPAYDPRRYRALAARTESLGFSHVWIPDERFYHDMAVSMTQVAMATTAITVGCAVTDPFIRHPALTAEMIASLDDVAGGRLIAGIGSGLAGFKALGITPRRPVRAIREAIDIMRALWTGEALDYHGEVFTFNNSKLDVTPVRPRIPIYIAGRGPSVLRLSGRLADGVIIGSLASAAGLEYAFDQINSGLREANRQRADIRTVLWLHTAIARDGDMARQVVRPVVANVLSSSRAVLGELGVRPGLRNAVAEVEHDLASPDMARLSGMIDEDTLRMFSVAGTPAEVRNRLSEFDRSRVDHLVLVPWLVPGQTLESFLDACAHS